MNVDKELIEVALKNLGYSRTVQRVISMESELAVPKGENYLSSIYRITLKVVLGNGRLAKKSLILKVVPTEKAKGALVRELEVFKSETLVYSTVLREMEMLMEEFGDTNDPLWCKLVHYEPYKSLFLEDLKASGFRMRKRQECLDLDHSLLVLRNLGRFHAMAKILEQRGIVSKDDYKPYALVTHRGLMKCFIYYPLQILSKVIEDHWGPEWYDIAQKLKVPYEILIEKMIELGKYDESRFNCLNHGDCWSNNMMFKYDWQNKPYTMRFIDFQIVNYGPASYDVAYFLQSSVPWTVRSKHIDTLLDTYHESLISCLEAYNYEGARPSREDLSNVIDDALPASLFATIMIRVAVLLENPEDLEFGRILASRGTDGLNPEVYGNLYKEASSEDIKWVADALSKFY